MKRRLYSFAKPAILSSCLALGLVLTGNRVIGAGIDLTESPDALATAAKKDAAAQYKLAIYNLYGVGMVRNEKEALNLLRKAAGSGHAEAQHLLGLCYAIGDGLSKADEKEAFKWYQKAADQGLTTAEFKVAYCYENGTGTAKNDAEALKWYKKVAAKGSGEAQFAVGRMYSVSGPSQDYREAAKWYKQAAEQGHKGAQFAYGNAWLLGQGVDGRDVVEAYKWISLAASAGDEDAVKRRDTLPTTYRMTPEQVQEGKKRAEQFAKK